MGIKILAFSGSDRKGSVNLALLKAIAPILEAKGAEVTLIQLKSYAMPIFDGDLEEQAGLPEGAKQFRQQLINHDGFLIASPEYNGFFTPLLKNAIDWASRPDQPDDPPLVAFRGKTACLVGASPGKLGGLRSIMTLRQLLSGIGVHVIPSQVAVGGAGDKFNEDGSLSALAPRKTLEDALDQLYQTTKALKS